MALFFVAAMVGGLGQLSIAAEETRWTDDGTGSFLSAHQPFTFTAFHNDFHLGGGRIVAVTDLNGDNYPDVVRTEVFSDQTSIWFNDKRGNFYDNHQSLANFYVSVVGDVTGDHAPDLVGIWRDPVSATETFAFSINDGNGYFHDPYFVYIDDWVNGPLDYTTLGKASLLIGD